MNTTVLLIISKTFLHNSYPKVSRQYTIQNNLTHFIRQSEQQQYLDDIFNFNQLQLKVSGVIN